MTTRRGGLSIAIGLVAPGILGFVLLAPGGGLLEPLAPANAVAQEAAEDDAPDCYGCHQCHGSQLAVESVDGGTLTPWSLQQPDGGGRAVVTFDPSKVDPAKIKRGAGGRPIFDSKTWPNTGIGRMNLDGSRGSCTACHSRHDFSARRARQPENCGKCHLGPDHPQKEIYEESKHGIAYRDLKDQMNLSAGKWVLGEDYSAAPTCATCHMSATRNQPITHYPRKRISWNNRPPASVLLDTDEHHNVVSDPEKIEWTWFFLWHHEGRRARHGASMMAPDYAHWHGTYEVADRWYNELVPEAREIIEHGKQDPAKRAGAEAVEKLLNAILAAPEHQYATTGKLPAK